jgi:hypothetical protein
MKNQITGTKLKAKKKKGCHLKSIIITISFIILTYNPYKNQNASTIF